MTHTLVRALRSVAAVIVGYIVMVVLITLAQEGLFGGVTFHGSSWTVLTVAGALTFVSAGAGGAVAAWIAGHHGRIHAGVMGALVVIETTALITTGSFAGPLWFDLAASASLIVGILLGAYLLETLRHAESSSRHSPS